LTYLTIVRLIFLLPALWFVLTRYQSIIAVAWVQAVIALLSGILSLAVAAEMFHIKLKDILIQFQPSFISGLVMSAAVIGVLALLKHTPALVQLLAAVVVGIATYGGMFWLQGPERLKETFKLITSAVRGG
jgi:ABC-type amino acid transport system permease subunit